ncbi:MAG: stage III sporulation protein AE [Firmicutes bacterium]|nr:stage III sporulation protein AE [Bacillota bacterium]
MGTGPVFRRKAQWQRMWWMSVSLACLLICLLWPSRPVMAQTDSPPASGLPPPVAAVDHQAAAQAPVPSVPTPVQLAKAQTATLSQGAIEQAWNQVATQYGGFIPTSLDGSWVSQFLPGGEGLSASSVVHGFVQYLISMLLDNGKLLGMILILAVLAAVLEAMQTAFESPLVSKTAFFIVYLVIVALAITSFRTATQFAGVAIDDMTSLMFGSLPVVLALITASGGLTSAAAFHPLIVFMVNAMGALVHNWVFPMIFFAAVLSLVSVISDRFKVTELAEFIRNVTLAVLGGGMSIFLGVMSVQGSLTSVADGVTLRSAKFVASTFVPFIGKALSDASESIAGASLLVKNATGMASAVLLLLICAFPALKILALSLVYSGAAAILQPLGDTPVILALSTVGKSLSLVFAALAAVGLMFFFSLVITVAATNITAFVR